MNIDDLSTVQKQIVSALDSLGERARFSEAVVAKRIRELSKLDTKKKAGLALNDIEKAISYFEENGIAFYTLTMNSANDLLIEKSAQSSPLKDDFRSRRLKSEKSMTIFTDSDFENKAGIKKIKAKKRTERKSLNINGDYDFYDE